MASRCMLNAPDSKGTTMNYTIILYNFHRHISSYLQTGSPNMLYLLRRGGSHVTSLLALLCQIDSLSNSRSHAIDLRPAKSLS